MIKHYMIDITLVVIKRMNTYSFNHLFLSLFLGISGKGCSALFSSSMHSGAYHFKVPLLNLFPGDFLILGCNGDVIQTFGCYQCDVLKVWGNTVPIQSNVAFSFVDIVFL